MEATISSTYLIRYGAVPEVARFASELSDIQERGTVVVVQTHRGELLGTVLDKLKATSKATETDFQVLRTATEEDHRQAAALRQKAETEFPVWQQRIASWNLAIELIDVEWTLDGSKQILYVLTERGPDTTNLALQAAAAGLGIIEVQPVSAEGLVSLPASSGGGCGTGGCGCHES